MMLRKFRATAPLCMSTHCPCMCMTDPLCMSMDSAFVNPDVFVRKFRARDVLCVFCALCFLGSAQEFMRMVLPKDLKYKISCYS